ncbi:MAG: hypothetical protein LC687_06185 [Actinobacteria bacterium]|nr:hypothetical protein [Actinomycetota bacterium]
MKDFQMPILILAATGVAVYHALKTLGGVSVGFSITRADLMSKDEEEMMLTVFDCPECGLPAEVAGMALDIKEDNTATPCYIVNCFGDHNMIAVTTQWLQENALK